MGLAQRLTNLVRTYDRELFCERNKAGTLCIYRNGYTGEKYDVDGETIVWSRPTPFFIFALTHNWQYQGRPVEWGRDVIINRLKAMDLWKDRTLVDELAEGYHKDEESFDRELDNTIEAFVKDFRRPFQKAFEGVRTCNMEKISSRQKGEL